MGANDACGGPPWHLGVSGVRCSGLGFFVEGCCCAPPMLPIMTAWMVLCVLGLLGRTFWTTYGICQLRVVCRLGPFGAGGLPTAHWSVCMCHRYAKPDSSESPKLNSHPCCR